MRLITVVVRPSLFDIIKDALALFGVRGMTVEQVHRVGDNTGHVQIYRGQRFTMTAQPYVKIDLLVPEPELSDLTRVIDKILSSHGSDGAMWTSRVDLVVRVRTSEHGLDAL